MTQPADMGGERKANRGVHDLFTPLWDIEDYEWIAAAQTIHTQLPELLKNASEIEGPVLAYFGYPLPYGQRRVVIARKYYEMDETTRCHVIINDETSNAIKRVRLLDYKEFSWDKDENFVYTTGHGERGIDTDGWEHKDFEGCALLQNLNNELTIFRSGGNKLLMTEQLDQTDREDMQLLEEREMLQVLAGVLGGLSSTWHEPHVTGELQ